MAANATNRETGRDRIASLLTTALVGGGKPVQAVYSGKVADFEGRSPIVTVTSGASLREYKYQGSTQWHNWFAYTIWVFVSYKHGDQEAEDLLDLIEKGIANVIMDNRHDDGYWDIIEYSDPTDASGDVVVGGTPYRREIIGVRARVGHG